MATCLVMPQVIFCIKVGRANEPARMKGNGGVFGPNLKGAERGICKILLRSIHELKKCSKGPSDIVKGF